jgi:hypothetical protein
LWRSDGVLPLPHTPLGVAWLHCERTRPPALTRAVVAHRHQRKQHAPPGHSSSSTREVCGGKSPWRTSPYRLCSAPRPHVFSPHMFQELLSMLVPLPASAGGRPPRLVSPETDTTRQHRGAYHAPRPTLSVMHHPCLNACHHSKLFERFTVAFQGRPGKKNMVLTSVVAWPLLFSLGVGSTPETPS